VGGGEVWTELDGRSVSGDGFVKPAKSFRALPRLLYASGKSGRSSKARWKQRIASRNAPGAQRFAEVVVSLGILGPQTQRVPVACGRLLPATFGEETLRGSGEAPAPTDARGSRANKLDRLAAAAGLMRDHPQKVQAVEVVACCSRMSR